MKKLIKKFSIGLIAAQLLMPMGNIVYGSNEGLKSFSTGEKILVAGNPVVIPQSDYVKSEEFRGIWVSSVYNLDFPSKKGMSLADFKKEYIKLLNDVESLNLNAVIFQVRPKMDAFYPSDLNPWSEFLTGTEGKSPNWDPLKWMIDETHNRGLEFHAWFNPYRVNTTTSNETSKLEDMAKLSNGNWAKNRPEDVFKYKGKLYLNPGNDSVIDYVSESIMEVVRKYEVDGIHLDDYFYPNTPINEGEIFYGDEESRSFKNNNRGIKKLSDWRRDNIDRQIVSIKNALDNYNLVNKRDVKFGVSPFGIWGHKEQHKDLGSNTPMTSIASYDNQFADTRKWVKNNWIDYIAPQLYWTFDTKAAPYGELVNWWVDTVKETDVDLYIGLASYKKADNNNKETSPWNNPREISNQLKYNSQFEEINGSIFFKYKSFFDYTNPVNKEFVNILKNEHFYSKATIPNKAQESIALENQYPLSVTKTVEGNALNWYDLGNRDIESYLIYRQEVENGKAVKSKLLHQFLKSDILFYVDRDIKSGTDYIYSIIGIDRYSKSMATKK